MERSFICGISIIVYMMSKNTLNLYLVIPAVASLIPLLPRGYHTWGYVIAIVVCALVFTATRKIDFFLWQRAVAAASLSIIAISVYSIAAGEVYRTSPGQLASEGAIIVSLIYIFDAFYKTIHIAVDEKFKAAEAKRPSCQLSMMAFVTVSLLIINGLGLSFLIWMAIIFIALWTLVCTDVGMALFVTAAGGLNAALMGQEQWEIMATAMLGILAASYVKVHGFVFVTAVFAVVCWFAGGLENSAAAEIDKYYLIIPALAFVPLYWKFGSAMRSAINIFAWRNEAADEAEGNYIEGVLKDKISQISDISELYSTYLDSRAMLANQFNITRQIMEDIRWQISRQGRKAARKESYKFNVNIAVSQCAASGAINGDCCGWQDIGDGRVVMVVSDGMGKGKKAAAESLMVTRTMISLLKTGVTVDLALKMINTIMLMKEDEDSYATLDMVTVDKVTGRAKFYKIGAAPTLIRRKSNVEEVKLSAVPLGIVNGLKVRYVETTLKKDDWIIMMSDGVSDSGGKIRETAADIRSQDPQTMSDLIMNRAADSYIGRERDDLTVMVARIV